MRNSSAELDDLKISRRTVLTVAGVMMGTAALYLSNAESAAAATAGIVLEPVTDDPTQFLSSNPYRALTYPRQLAMRVRNPGAQLSGGATIEIAFDTRFYSLATTAIVTLANRPVTDVHITQSRTDDQTGLTTWTVVIGTPIPQMTTVDEALVITLGSAKNLLYPYDLPQVPGPVTAGLKGRASSGPAATRRTLSGDQHTLVGGLPWGVQLSAFWNRKVWGKHDRYRYFYPAQVTLRSTGPAGVPHPVTFLIGLDPQMVSDLKPSFVRLNNQNVAVTVERMRSTRTSSIFETQWRVVRLLGPTDVLEVGFDSVLLDPGAALETIKHPTISLGADELDSRERVTGRTSVARQDSIWQ